MLYSLVEQSYEVSCLIIHTSVSAISNVLLQNYEHVVNQTWCKCSNTVGTYKPCTGILYIHFEIFSTLLVSSWLCLGCPAGRCEMCAKGQSYLHQSGINQRGREEIIRAIKKECHARHFSTLFPPWCIRNCDVHATVMHLGEVPLDSAFSLLVVDFQQTMLFVVWFM